MLSVRALAMVALWAAEPFLALTGWNKVVLLPPSSLLPAASPSTTGHRVLLGNFHEPSQPSTLTEKDPFDFCWASERNQPLEESDKRRCPCRRACGWEQGSDGSLYFCTRAAKTKSFPLTAALCEGRRRGRGGIPIRDCKNSSLCVCFH